MYVLQIRELELWKGSLALSSWQKKDVNWGISDQSVFVVQASAGTCTWRVQEEVAIMGLV